MSGNGGTAGRKRASSRKRLVLKIGLALIVAVLIAAVAVVLVVRSRSFHQYLLSQMVQRAEQATGAKVEIGDFTFHWKGLRLDFYRIKIHGTEPPSSKPLLSVQHAALSVKVLSLARLKFQLSSLIVDDPTVHLIIDKDGRSNLPHPPASKSGKPFDVFNLAVRRFVLNHGEIDYNDRTIPLQAELHHFHMAVDFDARKDEYGGALSYADGTIQSGSFGPLNHSLTASFSATPHGIQVNPLTITAEHSHVSIQAKLTDYNHPSVEGSYTASLSVNELRRWIKASDLPTGDVKASGVFGYQYIPGRALLESLSAEGRMTSAKLSLKLPSINAEAEAISCKYRLDQGNIEVHDARLRLFGGIISASLKLLHLRQQLQGSMNVSARSVSLGRAQSSLRKTEIAKVPVQGLLDGDASVTWRDNLKLLRIHSDATIRPPATAASVTAGPAPIPLTGVIHLDYAGDQLALNKTVLRAPHTEVDLDGSVGRNSTLAIHARSDNLQETDRLAAIMRRSLTSSPSASIQPVGLAGSGAFQGELEGSIENPRLTGSLTAANLKFHRVTLSQVQTGIDLSSSQIVLRQGELAEGSARVRFNVSAALRNWSYEPSNRITLELSTTAAPLSDLKGMFGVSVPVEGALSAHIEIHGSELSPAGEGVIEATKVTAWNQPVQSILARFHGTGRAINSTLTLKSTAGDASGSVTYDLGTEEYEGEISVPQLHLRQIQWVKERNLPISGTMSVSAKGHGSIKSPQLTASIEIPHLKIRDETFKNVEAQAAIAQGIATIKADSNLAGASLHAGGTVSLSQDYAADLTFSTGIVEIGPFLEHYIAPGNENLKGQLELAGWLKGPLKDAKQVQAHIEVPILRLSYAPIELANNEPISADYRNGVIVVSPVELKGSGTDIHLKGTASLADGEPLSAEATGVVDLGALKLLYPEWNSSGTLQLDIKVTGSRRQPNFQGQMRIVNALLEPPNSPIGIEKLNAVLALTRDRANIQSLTAEVGGGAVSARGFVSYNHGLQFNLGITGRSIRLRYPKGVREILDGDLTFTGSLASAAIGGQVLIDRLSFTQSFDLASFVSQFGSGPAAAPAPGLAGHVNLNVAVRSSQELALNSTAVSLRGSADLRVRGTLADPVILGRASLAGGQVFFNGRRYQLQGGVISFHNPVTTEPVVNLHVTTTVNQYNLSVNFIGPFDRLRTTYTSDPPLPPLDILNLLLTGQTAEAPGTGFGAQSLLAQGLAGQVSSRVQKLAGLSSLTIDPQVGGHGTNPGARIGVQEQVTRKLFFTFSVDVTTAQDDIVQVEYQISRRLSLQAVRDQNNGYSLEVKVRKTF